MDSDKYDLLTFDANTRDEIAQHLKQRCEDVQKLRWNINFQVECIRETNDGETDYS